MPEPSDQASQRQRRANRIGVRTLRQRPKLVGALADGEPVYEIRSVRLVLRGQTPHFNRLVVCERCGQDQAGAPVLAPADLDLQLRPMICAHCVQRAGVSSVWEPEAGWPPADPVSPPAEEAQAVAEPSPPPPWPEAVRLDAMERSLEAVGARVEQLSHLAEVQTAAQAERRRAEEAALASLREAVSQALAGARAEIGSVSGDLLKSRAELTHLVEAQRIDLTIVVGELVQARSEMQRAVRATQDVAEAQMRVEQRMADAASPASVGAVVDERLQELAAQLAQGMARIDALLEGDGTSSARLAELEERLDRLAARTDVWASVEDVATMHEVVDERLQELAAQSAQGTARIDTLLGANNETTGHLAGLEERIDRLAGELALEQGRAQAGEGVMQASADELARLQAAVDERLGELAAQVAQGTERIGVLLDANGETTGRLGRLEERLEGLAGRLTVRPREQPVPEAAGVAPSTGENGVPLLDDLEVLLQGASDRLAALSGGRRTRLRRPFDEPERRR